MNDIVKITIIVSILVYVNLSATEYVSHRWIMHDKYFKYYHDDHMRHHTTVLPDMTLDVSSLEDKHSGLFFNYEGRRRS